MVVLVALTTIAGANVSSNSPSSCIHVRDHRAHRWLLRMPSIRRRQRYIGRSAGLGQQERVAWTGRPGASLPASHRQVHIYPDIIELWIFGPHAWRLDSASRSWHV